MPYTGIMQGKNLSTAQDQLMTQIAPDSLRRLMSMIYTGSSELSAGNSSPGGQGKTAGPETKGRVNSGALATAGGMVGGPVGAAAGYGIGTITNLLS